MVTDRRHQHSENQPHYRHLFVMAVLSFASMYVLMYAMVNVFADVYNNVNQVYMAGLMTAPMIVIELVVMRAMYADRLANVVIGSVAIAVGIACFVSIRQQTTVSDRQFLRSMIPHHGGAILMCREANLTDPDLQRLCTTIIASQQAEIDQMKAKLRQLE